MFDVTELHRWGMLHPLGDFPPTATGEFHFDPGFGTKHYDPWGALLVTDEEIIRYYAWFLKRRGKPVWLSRLWGPHVSVVKHEEPPCKTLWGTAFPPVEFRYSDLIRW